MIQMMYYFRWDSEVYIWWVMNGSEATQLTEGDGTVTICQRSEFYIWYSNFIERFFTLHSFKPNVVPTMDVTITGLTINHDKIPDG